MIIGSRYFFSNYDDFITKDIDELLIIDNPTAFKYCRQTLIKGHDIFEYARRPIDDIIDYSLRANLGMRISIFLIPEFVHELGGDFDVLPKVKPLLDVLDEKHMYLKVIYESYLENGDFVLTDEQRLKAYESYKAARPKYYKK